MSSHIATLRIIGSIFLGFLVAGCSPTAFIERYLPPEKNRITPYEIVPQSLAWASVPGQLTVMQRVVGREIEQVISLPNGTSVSGDNQLIMLASDYGGARLRFGALRTRLGGFPSPFSGLEAEDMTTETDSLGPFSYAVANFGDINCVLAIRKVGGTQRLIPLKQDMIDAVLRNCINGPASEALMPIRDTSFGLTPPATASGIQLLSPLSAPIPD